MFGIGKGRGPQKKPQPKSQPKPTPKTQQRILIVEDDEKIRSMLGRFLESEGHFVHQASNGQEAVATVAREKQFDAIFLDVKMPKMSGVTAFQEMSGKASAKNVIFMTAFSIDQELKSLMQHEEIGYIHKPYKLNEITQALERLSTKRAESKQAASKPADPKPGHSKTTDVKQDGSTRGGSGLTVEP